MNMKVKTSVRYRTFSCLDSEKPSGVAWDHCSAVGGPPSGPSSAGSWQLLDLRPHGRMGCAGGGGARSPVPVLTSPQDAEQQQEHSSTAKQIPERPVSWAQMRQAQVRGPR